MLALLLLITAISPCRSEIRIEKSTENLLDAASEVISSFESRAVTINLILALSDETKRERSNLINNLVANCNVVYVEDVDFITQRQRLYNIILIENYSYFLRLSRRLSSDNFEIDGIYLVLLVAGPIREMPEITRQLWRVFIHHVNFIVETENGTSMISFWPFSHDKCNDSAPMTTNVRELNSQTISKRSGFYPKKLSNLYQCPVKVVTFNCPPMMMIHYDDQKNFELSGPDGEMLNVLAKLFNFRIDLIHISDDVR
jgi:hypothetical protein